MSRPAPERPGDALPTAEDFAGWPPLGALSAHAVAGPVTAELVRLDARAREAAEPFCRNAPSGAAPALRLQWTRAERPAWLGVAPGDTARSAAWIEGGALAWATHHVALLMDSAAERGIVVMTDQAADEAARSVQNVLRVAVAWRLAASHRGLLLHASAVAAGGGAVVFVGPSGAGKSTAAALSAPRAVLADDACILTVDDGAATLHPAPFWADATIAGRSDDPRPLPVAGLYRLAHAERPSISPLPGARGAAAVAAHAPFLSGLQPLLDPADTAARIAAAARPALLEFAKDPSFWTDIDNDMDSRGHAAGARSPA